MKKITPVQKNVGKYPQYSFIWHDFKKEPFTSPLYIQMAGNSHWIKGCYRMRTATEELSVALVTMGSMNYSQDGRKYVVRPGELYLIRQGTVITIEPGGDGFCYARVLSIGGAFIQSILHSLGLASTDVISHHEPDRLAEIIKSARKTLLLKPDSLPADLSGLAMQFLTECAMSTASERYSPILQKAVSYAKRNITGKCTREDMCCCAGVSAPHLARLFKEQFGQGPIDYYLHLKMEHAKTLLVSSNISIKEIAASLGYDNQLYFSSEFKKRVGMSPKFFRQKQTIYTP